MPLPKGFLHGEIEKVRQADGLILAESSYAPGQQIRVHSHDHARLMLVLRGEFSERFEGHPRESSAGSVIFRPVDERHTDAIGTRGARCFCVDIAPEWLLRAGEDCRVFSESADYRGGMLGHLAHMLHGEFWQHHEVSGLFIEGILLGIVAEASRRAVRIAGHVPPPWLERAREMLHSQFTERFTMSSIAAAVGVHPVHLARMFRHCYQCTPGEYVRRLRLDFACQRISASDSSLAEIALSAGFCDQSHFSRDFKTHTGLTPAQFRLIRRTR
ncbi:MAG: helix-turn-helix transcriptional regulator [Acidobacteria bacterium]|nr:helix-turn-helix transcriptional regulator [Acidobacteriota bacterium]